MQGISTEELGCEFWLLPFFVGGKMYTTYNLIYHFNHFKACSSVSLRTFTLLYNPPPHPAPELFSLYKSKTLCPGSTSHPFPPPLCLW